MMMHTYCWGDLLADFYFKIRSMMFNDWMYGEGCIQDIDWIRFL